MDSAIPDHQLIKKAKNDPEAFGQLYDRYYQKIFRFILSRTSDYNLAQDLTSETFFRALKNIWRYQLSAKPFSAWLYKIAVSQISDFYRQKSNYCELTLEECPELISKNGSLHSYLNEKNMDLDRLKQIKILSFLLNKLKKAEHTIIVLRYYEEMGFKEISQAMGMKINTVKSHWHRALKKLNKLFYKYYHQNFNEELFQTKYRESFGRHEAGSP